MDRRQFLTGVTSGAIACGLASSTSTRAAGDAATLPTRKLGRSGVEVTILALGGFTGMKEPRTAAFDPVELAQTAFDAGIRYFDTAPAYNDGQSELNYGEALAGRRDQVFLATKLGQRTYDGAMREIEVSLKRLRTDHVDLLQIHGARVDEDLASWGKPDGVFTALEKLRQEKVTRLIGVTGHESADTMCQAITMYAFDTILTTFNPTEKRRIYMQKVLPLADEKQMGVIAMKVMGGAFGSLAVGNPPKNDGKPNHDDAPHQSSAGDLVRYVLGLPITVAVVGMKSIPELQVNVAAARQQPFDEPHRHALEEQMA